jgi:hypothetical protein
MKARITAMAAILGVITILSTHMSTHGLSPGLKSAHADPPSIMGSGNFDLQYNSDFGIQYDILRDNGVKLARINAYPTDYWNGSAPVTSVVMDNTIKQAYSKGITPIMHFSYYASNLTEFGIPLGSKSKWYAIGQAYATRYRPNSPWLQSQGINNWGVTIYLALNEPDLYVWWTRGDYNGVPHNSGMPINSSSPYNSQFGGNYHDALEGLSDGVKGVSSTLKVINGGFATQNSARSYTCTGYASGVADLFNNGKLDGLNLHTYNDAWQAPLYPDAGWNNEWSVHRQFALVKSNSGITRDLDFYSDEFNYKNYDTYGASFDEDRTARQFFTVLWQHLGVPKNNGTSATKMAMIWTLFYGEDIYRTWNGDSLVPYSPRKSARAYYFVAQQTAGMEFATLDPFNSGEWTMTGGGKKAWIWTNMRSYTNRLNTPWTVTGIPSGTSQLRVYGWDGFNGPRQTINLTAGQTSATISGLAENETYMVMSVPGTPAPNNGFSTTFESGQPQPTWNDSIDGIRDVTGYLSGISPECATRTNEPGISGTALMYSGRATANYAYCYYKVFSVNIPVTSTTTLSYDIFPQQDNGRYVGVDLLCSDGTVLRDSGAVDSNGRSFHPNAGHGGAIPLNAWTTIRGTIGNKLAGKTITKIWVAFDRATNAVGQYRGYIDNIRIQSVSVPIGQRIGFKSTVNGKYVTNNTNAAATLQAPSATSINAWEKFDVYDAGNGFVALRAVNNGLFVSSNQNNGGNLQAGWATNIGTWELFSWTDLGNNNFALKANINGKFVSCDQNDSAVLKAGWATGITSWETFNWTGTQ